MEAVVRSPSDPGSGLQSWRVELDADGTVRRSDPPDASLPEGVPFTEALHPDDVDAWRSAMAGGQMATGERLWRLRDGRTVLVRAEASGVLCLLDLTAPLVSRDDAAERRRRRTVADVTASLARELNDPVSIVLGRLELVTELGAGAPSPAGPHLGIALAHASRLAVSVRNLRQLGEPPAVGRTVRLSEVLDEALELLGRRADQIRTSIRPPSLALAGEGAAAVRALVGVLGAACAVTPPVVGIDVRARRHDDQIVVRVLGQRAARTGAPPGLALVTALLEASGGALEQQGPATWAVRLPAAPRRRGVAKGGQALAWGSSAFTARVAELFAAYDVSTRACSGVPDPDPDVRAVVLDARREHRSGWVVARRVVAERAALAGRVVLVCASCPPAIDGVKVVKPPLRRATLVDALVAG